MLLQVLISAPTTSVLALRTGTGGEAATTCLHVEGQWQWAPFALF